MNCSICTPNAEGTYICNQCMSEMKHLLRVIGYPRRGTREEELTIFDVSDIIQAKWPLAKLQKEG